VAFQDDDRGGGRAAALGGCVSLRFRHKRVPWHLPEKRPTATTKRRSARLIRSN
jgi:hypothetical protein